jgi:hypothetical protein
LLPEKTLNQQESHPKAVAEDQPGTSDRAANSPGEARSPAYNIIDLPDRATRTRFPQWLAVGTLVSLGLHGLLVFIPTGHESVTPPKPQENQVRITQLDGD